MKDGQSISALPLGSDVYLFRFCECVIDLDSQIADGALNLGMSQQKLHSSQVACASVDERRLCSTE